MDITRIKMGKNLSLILASLLELERLPMWAGGVPTSTIYNNSRELTAEGTRVWLKQLARRGIVEDLTPSSYQHRYRFTDKGRVWAEIIIERQGHHYL